MKEKEKVKLKVGDKFEFRKYNHFLNSEELIPTISNIKSIEYPKILLENGYLINLLDNKEYIVNDIKFTGKDLIVPKTICLRKGHFITTEEKYKNQSVCKIHKITMGNGLYVQFCGTIVKTIVFYNKDKPLPKEFFVNGILFNIDEITLPISFEEYSVLAEKLDNLQTKFDNLVKKNNYSLKTELSYKAEFGLNILGTDYDKIINKLQYFIDKQKMNLKSKNKKVA